MVVQFFKGGRTKQGAKSAVAYLLNERLEQGTAKVYAGNSDLTLKIINSINRKWKFTSGVISFEEPYEKVSSLLPQIKEEFERTFFPGLNKDQYNILYVLHTDKGRAELHFLVPRTELTTGKDLSIYTHKKDLMKKDLFQQYINNQYNLSNPLAKEKQETLKIEEKKWSNDNKELKKQVHSYVEEAIQKGLVGNREEVINLLQDAGFEIKRRGKDYISIKTDDMKRAIRLKGIYYGESFTSIAELGEEYSNARTADNRDLQEEIRRIREELNKRVSRDAETNRKKYKVTENRQQQSDKRDTRKHRLGTGAVQDKNELDMGNRGINSRNNNNPTISADDTFIRKDINKGVKDDSIRTKIIRAVRARTATKQYYLKEFKKLIPRAEQSNNREYDRNAEVKSEDRKTARNDTSTATANRVINSKLEELIKRLDELNKKLTELTNRVIKKIIQKRALEQVTGEKYIKVNQNLVNIAIKEATNKATTLQEFNEIVKSVCNVKFCRVDLKNKTIRIADLTINADTNAILDKINHNKENLQLYKNVINEAKEAGVELSIDDVRDIEIVEPSKVEIVTLEEEQRKTQQQQQHKSRGIRR